MKFLCLGIASLVFAASSLFAQPRLLDSFETLDGWQSVHTHGEGAAITLQSVPGKTGKAMLMDFEFMGFMGGVMAFKDFPLDFPANYQFVFDMRADAPVNNLEFRLVDSLGNVWWNNKLNYHFPDQWTTIHIKKHQFEYAWGPSYGGDIKRLARIEINISVASGGKGKVWIDNLRLEPLDENASHPIIARVQLSSTMQGVTPRINPGDTSVSAWRGAGRKSGEQVTLHMKGSPDFGGLAIGWDSLDYATDFDLLLSKDGKQWTTAYSVREGGGGREFVPTGEQEASLIRLDLKKSSRGKGYAFNTLEVREAAFSSSPNRLFKAIASESPAGFYPKYFHNSQSFWTLVGVSGDTREALLNEQGQIETDKESFSLIPSLYMDMSLITWTDVTTKPSLAESYLPIPSVQWNYRNEILLCIQAVAAGIEDSSVMLVRYRVENTARQARQGKLFVAFRPFQVDPPWQIFTMVGGAAKIDSIDCGRVIRVQDKDLVPLTPPASVGAASFDQGDVTRYLANGKVPPWKNVHDHFGYASGALEYIWDLPAGGSADFVVVVPFHGRASDYRLPMDGAKASAYFESQLQKVSDFWRRKLDPVTIALPAQERLIAQTIRSNLAYILINRDGPGLQPGSRSYERSWMRDGSMIATALLELGVTDEVRQYIDWYTGYQRADGFIPCIVDSRGAEAVPEHDAHGQFLYMVMQYFRFTHDTTWLRTRWEKFAKTARYIESLRAQRKTDSYKNGTPEQRACYGLVPQSISHEGYSAKPMHSYWDNFFCLRGLKDAAAMAAVVGDLAAQKEFSAEVEDYRKDIGNSMRLAMQLKKIDHVPGCVELGDEGGLSNTIIVNPVQEMQVVPFTALMNDLNQFWKEYEVRRDNTGQWWAYLPYEWRYVDMFVHLGDRARAGELFDYLMRDRRPPEWNHWAEIVWKEHDAPQNIGDMPHAWAGSDFLRAVRSMLVYERDRDTALVLGAGIPESWLADSNGVSVRGLPTYYGKLSYSIVKRGTGISVEIGGDVVVPPGNIILVSPLSTPLKSLKGDGRLADGGKEIIIERLPAKMVGE